MFNSRPFSRTVRPGLSAAVPGVPAAVCWLLRWLVINLLLMGTASAVVIDDLYTVAVAVESQSATELQRASRDALEELFVRVSGQEAVLSQEAIVSAIRQAKTYTKQYRYERVNIGEEDGERLLVELDFEPLLVDEVLRRAGVPLWSRNRPTVLVWLAVEDLDGRRFTSGERDRAILDAVMVHARRRGLAIKLPLLDLQDMVALSPGDIWRHDSGKLNQASERYHADTLLVGRVSRLSNGRWLGRWEFQFNGQRLRFDGEADTASGYVGGAFDRLAEALAAEYAIAPVTIAEGGILMRLSNVNNFVDYARAVKYLEGVAAIHHANVISLNGNELIIRLIADGQLPQLKQAFALDKRLLPQTAVHYQGAYPVALDYRWPTTADKPVAAAPEPSPPRAEAIDARQFDDMDELEQ